MRRLFLTTVITLGLGSLAAAQVAVQPQAAQPPPTLAQLGLIVYPAEGQAPEQQKADEAACTHWAETQTGLVLQAGQVDADSAAQAARAKAREAGRGAGTAGAVRGSLRGALIGAIVGDAGKGAAIGAVGGASRGSRASRAAQARAAQVGALEAEAENQQAIDTFLKAAAACLEGRKYSVTF